MRSSLCTPKMRYRSVKYRSNRENTTSFCDKNLKKSSDMFSDERHPSEPKPNLNFTMKVNRSNSDLKDKENEEDFSEKKFMKSSYINSFRQIANIERTHKETKLKIIDSKKKDSKRNRVYLPVLVEGDSFFTLLDNIHLPIVYIEEEIKKAKGKLKEEELNIGKIRANLKEIEKKCTKEIEEIEVAGVKGFQKLKGLLKANKVVQQQINLKFKSSFESTRAYLPEFYEKFEKSKKDCKELQKVIFATSPFELRQKEEFELISSHYF